MKNAFVIDLDRCSGCDSCIAACKLENGVGLGTYRCTVDRFVYGEWPAPKQYWLPRACQQCENAPCIEVCPTGASYREDEFGLVVVNPESCIGCQACVSACSFGCRWMDEDKAIVEKCDACLSRIKNGEKPACVHNCCCGARYFGDLDDPESEASKALAAADPATVHYIEDPTGAVPTTAYILATTAEWQDFATAIKPR